MQFDLAQIAIGAAAAALVGVAAGGAKAWYARRRRGGAGTAVGTSATGVDPVTGLMGRDAFELALQERLRAAEKKVEECCVLQVGLDDFRLVQDDGGRESADKALAAVAARLRGIAGPSASLARIASHEFALCLALPREAGEAAARRITEALPAPLELNGTTLELSASVGIAVASEHGSGPRLLGRAGAAMRAAQRSGGGAHAVFDPQIEAEYQSELTLAQDLQAALAKRQFELFFQPRIDARRLEVSAVEALLRWRHPSMGLVSPARFMPIAERFGLDRQIGEWVLDDVLRRAAAWRAAGLSLRAVVNVSGAQLRRDEFAAGLARALKKHAAPADSLVCELAEVDALENTAATRQAFARLAKLDVRIAVGEFSGRPEGLSALQKLPVHELSIARHLVAALPSDDEARRTVERIVAAAHARGLRVGGVGIESEAHRDQVVRLGCDDLQGFLFAKPMSARGVAIWSVDASRNLGQTLKPSQFKETMLYDGQREPDGFARTRVAPRQ